MPTLTYEPWYDDWLPPLPSFYSTQKSLPCTQAKTYKKRYYPITPTRECVQLLIMNMWNRHWILQQNASHTPAARRPVPESWDRYQNSRLRGKGEEWGCWSWPWLWRQCRHCQWWWWESYYMRRHAVSRLMKLLHRMHTGTGARQSFIYYSDV